MTISALAAGVAGMNLGLHVLSCALAAGRCRKTLPDRPLPAELPPISIVQPLCGIETFSKQTLASLFALDYREYEIVFCLADGADPIAPLVRRFMAAHPEIASRLLVGDDRISANPKLNNVVKGWKAARHGWICIADSNVLMPPDYLKRFVSNWRANSGIVCSPPIGAAPQGFAAEVECAFLNTYQARWQYASERVGNGFAQGKNMFWRREVLEAAGGIDALGVEIAEDAAATKLVQRQNLRAHLVDRPFVQPLGPRTLRDVWKRQLRWARLRRATFVGHFAAEIFTTSLLAIGAAAIAAPEFGLSPLAAAALAAAIWYGTEAWLAAISGWPLGRWSPLAWAARDVALPWLWLQGWLGDQFEWRGNTISVGDEEPQADIAEPFAPN
jgi:ceramide glucosyltransferase